MFVSIKKGTIYNNVCVSSFLLPSKFPTPLNHIDALKKLKEEISPIQHHVRVRENVYMLETRQTLPPTV